MYHLEQSTQTLLDSLNKIKNEIGSFDQCLYEDILEKEMLATENETPYMDLLTCSSAMISPKNVQKFQDSNNQKMSKVTKIETTHSNCPWPCTGKYDPSIGLGPLDNLFQNMVDKVIPQQQAFNNNPTIPVMNYQTNYSEYQTPIEIFDQSDKLTTIDQPNFDYIGNQFQTKVPNSIDYGLPQYTAEINSNAMEYNDFDFNNYVTFGFENNGFSKQSYDCRTTQETKEDQWYNDQQTNNYQIDQYEQQYYFNNNNNNNNMPYGVYNNGQGTYYQQIQ
ncbi:hypothetical protein RDWZM_005200 [Blomia tropicalis]|uniref:Uncharacterized protein n=1 Tax=Blomia tropicalis TaxID=40697 RepID=A0A9Q0M683_BLOTA|nr:hypothetical protein RDWZM_005200 [Blomia tropicalis]